MIFRQFLGLGIASPPSAAKKKLSSSHVHGGDSGCPGEDRENRGRITGFKREHAFPVRKPNGIWEAERFKNGFACCSMEQMRTSSKIRSVVPR